MERRKSVGRRIKLIGKSIIIKPKVEKRYEKPNTLPSNNGQSGANTRKIPAMAFIFFESRVDGPVFPSKLGIYPE